MPNRAACRLQFEELEALRRFLSEISSYEISSLKKYQDPDSKGFFHRYRQSEERDHASRPSKASSATCILALAGTGKLPSLVDESKAKDLLDTLLFSEWESAGLPVNNPFTVAFILEAVIVLKDSLKGYSPNEKTLARIKEAQDILKSALIEGQGLDKGAARLQSYPPSAYLTQLVVRVLKHQNELTPELRDAVLDWSWREIKLQLALLISKSKTADVYALAYSTIIVASLSSLSNATPDEKLILKRSLREIFRFQLKDGSWPSSRPLFHYPDVGSAYCYEYEMLVQLLQQEELENELLIYLPQFSKAAYALENIQFQLDNGGVGWASGHHPQLRGPESWSTASVFHFVHALNRLVAEAIRREIFRYLDAEYKPPRKSDLVYEKNGFAANLLDSKIVIDGQERSLSNELWAKFVEPLSNEIHKIKIGEPFPRNTPMSAIFFGPPGTSKTELTKHIAEFLGWPRIVIDPSHLVRNGLDQVQAEANKLFGMLAATERVVVLFDEFDEMVRDRSSSDSETLSRFLTTAMLPKLSLIYQRRRIVYILATNYIDHFDFAISRHGRFDVILQVMPPTAESKLKRWHEVRQKLDVLKVNVDPEVKARMEALTYGEFENMVSRILEAGSAQEVLKVIHREFERCTLERTTTEISMEGQLHTVKWADRCTQQRVYIRTPG